MNTFGKSAYRLQLPLDIGIYLIFNVADLTPFKGDVSTGEFLQEDAYELKEFPRKEPLKSERIIDTKVFKKTRRREYK